MEDPEIDPAIGQAVTFPRNGRFRDTTGGRDPSQGLMPSVGPS